MSPYYLEINRVFVNEIYHADPQGVSKPIFDVLSHVNGMKKGYEGLDIKDKNCWCFLQEWSAFADHTAFMHDKDLYPTLLNAITSFTTGYAMLHATFTDSPHPSLSAPFTEIATWTAKSPDAIDRVRDLLSSLAGAVVHLDGEPGVYRPSIGQTLEEENKFIFILGHDSIKDKSPALKNSEQIKHSIVQLLEVAKLDVQHVALKAFL